MGVAILLVYVMMVLTFNSLITPFVILFSLPLATIGAFPALYLTGRPIGVSALIGFLMLIGIVVTNAIVLLDLVERLRVRGPVDQATRSIEGGRTRVRPILMTAIATILALIPLAAGFNQGSIIAAELGTVVIGGLFSSTFLTLLVVPVVYSLVDGLKVAGRAAARIRPGRGGSLARGDGHARSRLTPRRPSAAPADSAAEPDPGYGPADVAGLTRPPPDPRPLTWSPPAAPRGRSGTRTVGVDSYRAASGRGRWRRASSHERDRNGPSAGRRLVPGWLVRLAAVGWRLLAAIALVLVLIRILTILSTVTASVLVAAIVAATFAPFVLNLRDRGWSRIKAAAAVFLGAAAVILATLLIVALAFLPYAKDAIADLHAGVDALRNLLTQYNVPPEVGSAIEQAANGVEAWLQSSASEIAGSVGIVFTIGLLATFLTFFFLMDGDRAWVWTLSSANEWRRDAITTSGHVALERVGGYLRGTAVIAAFDGLAEGLFLLILGVPHALPLAVIVFFGRFIPYIGGLVTTVLLLLVTLASQGTTAALILLVLIGILDVIQGKFLAPAIYNKTVHIHPAIVLTALPAGAALAGIVGLFVAIPVVAFALAITGAVIEVLGVEPTAPSTANPLVPVWLDRLGQWSWRLLVALALLGVAIAAAVQVPIVVLPLVLGIVLASTLLPLSRRLEARGWSKGRAALGATVGASLGVIVIVGLTIVALAGPASDIVSNAAAGANSSSDALGGQGERWSRSSKASAPASCSRSRGSSRASPGWP